MRDETQAPEAPAAPQRKLTPANENPWYVLMTLYGEQEGRKINKDLGRVDKRDSQAALNVIQAGICDGDQLGTRPNDKRRMGVL